MQHLTTPTNLLIVSGLILVLMELFVGIEAGFDLVLIGSILIISGLLGNLTGNAMGAFILASALSFVYIAFGRKIVKQKLTVKTKETNIDRLIGKKGVIIKSINPNQSGSIVIDDETWRAASSESINRNEQAEVVSIEGVTLQVKRV